MEHYDNKTSQPVDISYGLIDGNKQITVRPYYKKLSQEDVDGLLKSFSEGLANLKADCNRRKTFLLKKLKDVEQELLNIGYMESIMEDKDANICIEEPNPAPF